MLQPTEFMEGCNAGYFPDIRIRAFKTIAKRIPKNQFRQKKHISHCVRLSSSNRHATHHMSCRPGKKYSLRALIPSTQMPTSPPCRPVALFFHAAQPKIEMRCSWEGRVAVPDRRQSDISAVNQALRAFPSTCDSRMVLSAAIEPCRLRATRIFLFFACPAARFNILCDIVPVNSTKRSGFPKFIIPRSVCIYTFALQSYARHSSSYRLAIHSFPPTITTLIAFPHTTDSLSVHSLSFFSKPRRLKTRTVRCFRSRVSDMPRPHRKLAFANRMGHFIHFLYYIRITFHAPLRNVRGKAPFGHFSAAR